MVHLYKEQRTWTFCFHFFLLFQSKYLNNLLSFVASASSEKYIDFYDGRKENKQELILKTSDETRSELDGDDDAVCVVL